MAKQVKWTNDVTNYFIEYALLNEDEEFIIRTRVKGKSIVWQSEQLHCSTATVSRTIKELKEKYDVVQKEHPELFPKRKKSKREDELDEIPQYVKCRECQKCDNMTALELLDCQSKCDK